MDARVDRGLLAGFNIDALQAKTKQPPYSALWQRLLSRTRQVVDAARQGEFRVVTHGALSWYCHTPMVREAALIARLTGDSDCLAYVEQCINAADQAARSDRFDDVFKGRPPVHSYGEVALGGDICRAELSTDARQLLYRLMRDHAIDCHEGTGPYIGQSGGANVQICQTLNAAFCALAHGVECEHPHWPTVVEHATEYVRCYLQYGCDDGGIGYEGPGYSHEVFTLIYLFAQLLKQRGERDLFAEEPRLQRCIEGSFFLSAPGGNWLLNINDLGLHMPRNMPWLLNTAEHYDAPLHRGLWNAYQGPDHPIRPYGDAMPWLREHYEPGPAPIDQGASMLQTFIHWNAEAQVTPLEACKLPTSWYSPGTEFAVFRTSWSSDGVAIHLPGSGRSHVSQTHRHADCGHFTVWAYGEYLAIDTGRYNVDEDQHSVVLVDGECHLPTNGWGMSHRPGRKVNFQSNSLCSYICADAAHMKNCNWADRHFLFVPIADDDCYLVVIDNINKDNDIHRYLWQLQANPDCQLSLDQSKAMACVQGENARLDVTFMIPNASDFPQTPHRLSLSSDIKEWCWPYGRDVDTMHTRSGLQTTSFARPRLLADVHGANCRLLTVISPRRQDAPPLKIHRDNRNRLLQTVIQHEQGYDQIVAALDHGYIKTDSVQALAKLVLVRRDSSGAVTGSWALGNADVLAKPLPKSAFSRDNDES